MALDLNYLHRIINSWPAYRKYIENSGVNPARIKSIKDLPVLNKQFLRQAANSLPIKRIKYIVPSSGTTSEEFSYGLFGAEELSNSVVSISRHVNEFFQTEEKRTLLLNVLPGGISVNVPSVTVLPVGTRIDSALSAVKTFSGLFDQLIIVGEPVFAKNLLEEGVAAGIPWHLIPLNVILGGDWISETYRSYLGSILGTANVFSSMGAAEIGLNYFFETVETVLLRQILFHKKGVRTALFGKAPFTPMIFAYNKKNLYIEAAGDENFVPVLITTLDPKRILPLIRYQIGDCGRLLSAHEINEALAKSGYPGFFKEETGIFAHFGRGMSIGNIYPEQIKEILYKPEIADLVTGNFHMVPDYRPVLNVQMKKNVRLTSVIKARFRSAFPRIDMVLKLCDFNHFPCPLDYERKIQYIA